MVDGWSTSPRRPAGSRGDEDTPVTRVSRQFMAEACGGRRRLRPLRRLGKPILRGRCRTDGERRSRTARIEGACRGPTHHLSEQIGPQMDPPAVPGPSLKRENCCFCGGFASSGRLDCNQRPFGLQPNAPPRLRDYPRPYGPAAEAGGPAARALRVRLGPVRRPELSRHGLAWTGLPGDRRHPSPPAAAGRACPRRAPLQASPLQPEPGARLGACFAGSRCRAASAPRPTSLLPHRVRAPLRRANTP
jgi:hypothetical protein